MSRIRLSPGCAPYWRSSSTRERRRNQQTNAVIPHHRTPCFPFTTFLCALAGTMGTNCIVASASSRTFLGPRSLQAPSSQQPRLQSEFAATPTSSSAPKATSHRTGPRSRANDDGSPQPSASMPEPAHGASQRLRTALCASFSKHPAQRSAPQREGRRQQWGTAGRRNLPSPRGCVREGSQTSKNSLPKMTTKGSARAGPGRT